MHIITMTKKELAKHIIQSTIKKYVIETAAGWLLLQSTTQGIFSAEFIETEHAKQYESLDANIIKTVLIAGSPLQLKVWRAITDTPLQCTYKELAEKIGHPKAYRAVGSALAANKIAYFIPCHKVIRSNGNLGGYKWGIERKKIIAFL